ncbi:hypothetical protein B0T19DRAFT_66698 [Cercophora scortea]|uniref:Uncharacterized protein n=1 Tax=Cercophora scortea TaxID=314031 RepID=A0AAE0J5E9_9PEZI|nr:hypothetical protein B0T19DRAFT_66698 [Cercophora scortea]
MATNVWLCDGAVILASAVGLGLLSGRAYCRHGLEPGDFAASLSEPEPEEAGRGDGRCQCLASLGVHARHPAFALCCRCTFLALPCLAPAPNPFPHFQLCNQNHHLFSFPALFSPSQRKHPPDDYISRFCFCALPTRPSHRLLKPHNHPTGTYVWISVPRWPVLPSPVLSCPCLALPCRVHCIRRLLHRTTSPATPPRARCRHHGCDDDAAALTIADRRRRALIAPTWSFNCSSAQPEFQVVLARHGAETLEGCAWEPRERMPHRERGASFASHEVSTARIHFASTPPLRR